MCVSVSMSVSVCLFRFVYRTQLNDLQDLKWWPYKCL